MSDTTKVPTSVPQSSAPPATQPSAPPTSGALTNASVTPTPARRVDPRDPWEGAEAKPLTAPAFDQITKKNPNIELRWVNRSVATSSTPHLRYEQMLAMGWVPVKATMNAAGVVECADVVPPIGCYKDGHLQIYDVILMKMDRQKYLGDLRWKNERVNKAIRRSGLAKTTEELRNAFAAEGVTNKARGKVEVFIPGSKEIDQMSK